MVEGSVRETSESVVRVENVLRFANVPSPISPELKSRLILLDRYTPTIDDEHNAISYALKVFDLAEKSGHPYSELEQQVVTVGTLFTDIGKSGPKDSTPQQSELIVSIYSKENISHEDMTGNVRNFIMKYFKDESPQEKVILFQSFNLDPDKITMREFYNLHTQWTLDILEDSNLPREVIPGAACHHRLRGDNPGHILNENDSYTRTFGSATKYGRAEKLVGLLDQYDAFRRRSGLAHEEAIAKLQELVNGARNGYYADDVEIKQIIEDINLSLKPS